jgi:diaminopimelate decarboxylase
MNDLLASPSLDEVSRVFRLARDQGFIAAGDTSIVFHDLTRLRARAREAVRVFPAGTLHAVAVKANPLLPLLSMLRQSGLGAEAASFPEIRIAEAAGMPPDRIVFDSPVKTGEEIAYCLQRGIGLNADSLSELERIGGLIPPGGTASRIGIRINPQIGDGTIPATSVAGEWSKFGVPLGTDREALARAFRKYDWLRGVHVHVGSQGCPLEMLLEGTRRAVAFALEAAGGSAPEGRAFVLDIGGGLPATYDPAHPAPAMEEYAAGLARVCPELFRGAFRLVTEFGRYFHANTAWAISRVEYVKRAGQRTSAAIHLGADMFVRRTYGPSQWHHEFSVLDRDGKPKGGSRTPITIVGPLCFQGDVLARDLPLPTVEEGDFIVIHDAGAYTVSMWSRYNSRQMPLVLGHEAVEEVQGQEVGKVQGHKEAAKVQGHKEAAGKAGHEAVAETAGHEEPGIRIALLKKRKSAEDVLRFWGAWPD